MVHIYTVPSTNSKHYDLHYKALDENATFAYQLFLIIWQMRGLYSYSVEYKVYLGHK